MIVIFLLLFASFLSNIYLVGQVVSLKANRPSRGSNGRFQKR